MECLINANVKLTQLNFYSISLLGKDCIIEKDPFQYIHYSISLLGKDYVIKKDQFQYIQLINKNKRALELGYN